ncbi:MAG: hypothetical protein J5698_05005 [Bacteroidaceae bacterium]|nr:hypothetical protein [Bacteroidaceae bacterium]
MKQYSSFEKRGKDNATLAIRQAFNRFFSIFLPERPFFSSEVPFGCRLAVPIPACGDDASSPT